MDSDNVLPIGKRVIVAGHNDTRKGIIAGYTVVYQKRYNNSGFRYVVELHQGFYSEDKKVFVGEIVCIPELVEEDTD